MQKICHIATEHFRYDTRIFLKECNSLARIGYKVTFIVCDGKGDEVKNGIQIVDIGRKNDSALKRQIVGGYKALKKCLELNADIYHFHEHTFIIPALILLLKKHKVIFDAHEDTPAEILNRSTQSFWKKSISYGLYKSLDILTPKYFSGIVAATKSIEKKFLKRNTNTIAVCNYPIAGELLTKSSDAPKQNKICYIGGIFKIRGIVEVIHALEKIDTRLTLAGEFENQELKEEITHLRGWEKVDYKGFLNREQVAETLNTARAGIVTFLPGPNHNDSQPNKIFEYMSAGLPIVASHFPLWKELVEDNGCGLCVNPANPAEIAAAIKYILNNPIKATEMGQNGIKAVAEKYNWTEEERQLFNLYNLVLAK